MQGLQISMMLVHIDLFVGQAYSPLQWERLLVYLDIESVASLPLWTKRLAWYMEYGNPETISIKLSSDQA